MIYLPCLLVPTRVVQISINIEGYRCVRHPLFQWPNPELAVLLGVTAHDISGLIGRPDKGYSQAPVATDRMNASGYRSLPSWGQVVAVGPWGERHFPLLRQQW